MTRRLKEKEMTQHLDICLCLNLHIFAERITGICLYKRARDFCTRIKFAFRHFCYSSANWGGRVCGIAAAAAGEE